MANIDDILIGNLKDALQQAQRYLISGIVSAALLVVLSMDAPELIALEQKVDIPTVGKVAPGPAAIILWFAYIIFGFLANSTLGRIKKIALAITEVQMMDAALTYFSLITIDNVIMRVGTMLLAPVLIMIAYLVEQYRSANPIDVATAFMIILGFVLVAVPYIPLAVKLRKPLKDMCRRDNS